ncbi:FKBP-type peptidyl-prolyl cis-trans isomerase [Streptomyces sp. DSM 44917]|uniref:peptidylprolyl isomerase n=1 Tax=Streptomyces boetiae TaxID=3075541 RepID=A0ABU2L3S6_9ACTN|nr:FKBP-type peptidyl-prolyl cis-trans isomerase [Streptomyces sp. DSM 44917]MDT0305968.1 FKBP-type peptidyl-prolyl cis-trans isomerase [Streptomyces sp. DSM 44917]
MTRARRIVAALGVSTLLLTAAACGSEDDSGETSEGPLARVTGELGRSPEIELNEDARAGDEAVADVLSAGDGAVIEEGDYLRVDVVGQLAENGTPLLDTWNAAGDDPEAPHQQVIVQAGVDSYMRANVTRPLIGLTAGSRVKIEGQAGDMLGDGIADAGIDAEDGVVWVFDLVAASRVDPHGEAQGEQAPTEEGLPEVEAGGGEAATITVPEGQDPPEELAQQVLIEGDGAEVEAGQGVAVQYTGVLWDGGEQFDSSWDRESASAFQIGTGAVVDGWDEGLVGKRVGDRVLLVVPPDMGYGDEEAGDGAIPAGSTLVFVVDILAAF